MAEGVFVLVDGRLKILRPTSPDHEMAIPALLARNPEIIAGATTDGERRRLLLVERRATAESGSAGSLYVDSDAVPVLVELATADQASHRREALGRLLDQVASLVPDWNGRRTRDVVRLAHPGKRDDEILAATVGWRGPPDDYWARLESNLFDHRVRIVFVAHRLSDELVRIIAFLDQQLNDIDVLGVEVTHFGAGAVQVVAPRVWNGKACATGSGPEARADATLNPGTGVSASKASSVDHRGTPVHLQVVGPPALPPLPQRIPRSGKHRLER